ncbi:hypothetical protein [Aeromonas molluscorum]|jgi:hypothetical protein|uniref:Uncharacterized protein n=1 Tax=Aeromonas molluscorum 848 TaxID=1268236 RepID=R1F2Z3_9GAMM|nr:hypothetical protein [Aeromonas molluscorum]EOD54227.1 hypothetical protein G113_15418 [Aeromonas molluscorum 848]
MSTEAYLLLHKEGTVIAQPLAAPETGDLLVSLLQQGFVLAPRQILAGNSRQALACYENEISVLPGTQGVSTMERQS